MSETLAPCPFFRLPTPPPFLSRESSQILAGSPTQASAEQEEKGHVFPVL